MFEITRGEDFDCILSVIENAIYKIRNCAVTFNEVEWELEVIRAAMRQADQALEKELD